MGKEKNLFDNLKYCNVCRRTLPKEFEKDVCPACEESELFSKVKDFIRTHDVTEFEVAEEFNIPMRQIKIWIKEGRIEYKDIDASRLKNLHCITCGDPIQFGVYCQKCYKLKNAPKYETIKKPTDERMRFLE